MFRKSGNIFVFLYNRTVSGSEFMEEESSSMRACLPANSFAQVRFRQVQVDPLGFAVVVRVETLFLSQFWAAESISDIFRL